MKRTVILLIIIMAGSEAYSQWSRDNSYGYIFATNSSDKVTVGFNSLYIPTERLEVSGNIKSVGVKAGSFIDNDNAGFYLNPNGSSVLSSLTVTSLTSGTLSLSGILNASKLVDSDNTTFSVDPSGTSILNETRASIIKDRDNLSYFLDPNMNSNLFGLTLNSNLYWGQPTSSAEECGIVGGGTTGHLGLYSGYRYGNARGGNIQLIAGGSELDAGGDLIFIPGDGGTGLSGNIYMAPHLTSAKSGIGYSVGTTLQAKLDVNGSVRATSYITVSDGNLKENTETIENALDKILSLRGVGYTFKAKNETSRSLPAGKQLGFIAQEVEKVLPDAVFTDTEGIKGVEYNKVIPVLVEAIKDQQAQIEKLKKQLDHKLNSEIEDSAELFQNYPNPAAKNTIIKYTLPENKGGTILVYDLQGKQVKRLDLNVNSKAVEIQANDLGAGMYLYTLVVSGIEVDTKRMIITD